MSGHTLPKISTSHEAPVGNVVERLRAAIPTYEGVPISWPCEVRSQLLLEAAALLEWQNRHIDLLQEKVNAAGSCACAFDNPDDICARHSPHLRAALVEVQQLTRERDEARAEVENMREALKIAAGYVWYCYDAWHLTKDRVEAWRDLTKIRVVLNDERAGELEAKP